MPIQNTFTVSPRMWDDRALNYRISTGIAAAIQAMTVARFRDPDGTGDPSLQVNSFTVSLSVRSETPGYFSNDNSRAYAHRAELGSSMPVFEVTVTIEDLP